MRSVVSALESERDGLQRLLAEERQHGHGVETLLQSGRAKEAASAQQIRKMAQENANLQTLINEQNIKLKSLDSTFEVMAAKDALGYDDDVVGEEDGESVGKENDDDNDDSK